MADIKIQSFRPKRGGAAIAFSSKDRTELSKRTFPKLGAAAGLDIYWFDGSRTPEGQQLPLEYAAQTENLRAVHSNVVGGPDIAIAYSLKTLYDMGYEYIGLLENDIELSGDWWPALLELFDKGAADGLKIGCTSARAFTTRVLAQRDGYAVMCNHGAAMNFFHRDTIPLVLDFYRTTTVGELTDIVQETHGINTWKFEHAHLPRTAALSADWMFELSMFLQGYHAAALTPAHTENIDLNIAEKFNLHEVKDTEILPWHQKNWDALQTTHYQSPELGDMFYRLRRFQIDEATGLRIIMPHQLDSLLPDALQGEWKHKWLQMFGPFSLIAGTDAAIALPVMPGKWGVLFRTDNDADIPTFHSGRERLAVSVQTFHDQIKLAFPAAPPTDVCEIEFPVGCQWNGIAMEGFTEWMLAANAFNITRWLRFVV